MNNKSLFLAKVNFKYIKLAYLIAGITCLVELVQNFIYYLIGSNELLIGAGNLLLIVILLAPVLIVAVNYKKLMNIGAKKIDFFYGCLINYAVLAFALAIINTLFYYTFDKLFMTRALQSGNIIDIFGWAKNGAIVSIIIQTVIYFFVAVVVHSLTMIQNNWIGWTVDIIIIAILGLFIPIAPLRSFLVSVLKIIFSGDKYLLIIITDLILAAIIYTATLFKLNKKIV